ncbi:DUF1254 domain-containing protein [Enterococcus asini]|uniref:DUF1254 domain-containing protein n=1 Tax=Enterococcus asini TaxID=57732 RepID=UPI00288E83AE|nr:DUF1254 domain-containing protein [Enterococcus asini]MDT2755927.1 DUF1254 domain-containing protein [Enterococcus asini]
MDHLHEQAKKAFIIGFPLVFNLEQMQRFTNQGVGNLPPAPFNHFSHAVTKAKPTDEFVSVNNDTLYSVSQVDLSQGPVLFRIPVISKRYYVFQLVDAWTENFAYLGQRSLGEAGGEFLLLPPGWTETLPKDREIIHCPTKLISIVGRWACGEEELATVKALQAQVSLESLTQSKSGYQWPEFTEYKLVFWEKLWRYLQDFPLSPAFADLAPTLADLNLLAAKNPFTNMEESLQLALLAGAEEGVKAIDHCLLNGNGEQENGWQKNYHIFDYNGEFFERGTLNHPDWIMPCDTLDQLLELSLRRAAAAKGGLWGNHGYEAIYLPIYVDEQKEQLTGSKNYKITFQKTPPTNAFWSLTMYALPDYYLVANEIRRYSIGDRTPDLVYEGEELTIYLSHTPPKEPTQKQNWLPTPAGDFRPLLRVYLPKEEFFNGSYQLPAIEVSSI